VDLAKVKTLLAAKLEISMGSGEKEWFEPVWVENTKKEPFERFPKLLRSESEFKGCRRGYDAPWTLSHLDLSHSNISIADTNQKRLYRKLKVRLYSGQACRAPAASLHLSS